MSNSSDISPQKQDLLKAMDEDMNENSINIEAPAGEGANANIRTEWDAAAALQHEGDTSLLSTADTEAMQTEGYNAQINQTVADSIQSNVKANPEGVQAALTNGMGILLYLEVRLQSDSGNINYAGFKADATSNAYVDFITKRGSMEAAAMVMAGDIRTVMQTQTLTVSEKAQLTGVLTEIVGSAELAEAYVGQAAAGADAGIVSAGDGNAANMDEGIESGYNDKQATRGIGATAKVEKKGNKPPLVGLLTPELTKLHYDNINETITNYYENCDNPEVISTDANGIKWGYKEFNSDANKIELAEQLQDYMNSIPAGQRGDLRVPDYTKIKGIKISDTGEVRLVEAWKPGTDGAVSGTREMKVIKAVNPDGNRMVIDRIGTGNGNYFSPMRPDGTPYNLAQRAIGDYLPEPDITANDSYHQYELVTDFTRENFERAINESKVLSADEKKLLFKLLSKFYKDAASKVDTVGHNGEAYLGASDGVKTGIIDHMFTNGDGGAIQYIAPFDADTLILLDMLEQIK